MGKSPSLSAVEAIKQQIIDAGLLKKEVNEKLEEELKPNLKHEKVDNKLWEAKKKALVELANMIKKFEEKLKDRETEVNYGKYHMDNVIADLKTGLTMVKKTSDDYQQKQNIALQKLSVFKIKIKPSDTSKRAQTVLDYIKDKKYAPPQPIIKKSKP